MRRLLFIAVAALALLVPAFAHAATKYMAPAGSNAAAGDLATPWLTFDYAFAQLACGDTLILKDGTYTTATNTRPYVLSKACSVSLPFTIRALNQRLAWISGTGCETTFLVNLSSYIVLDGLRISSAVNGGCTQPNAILGGIDSNHLTIKNVLYHTVNRSANFIVQSFTRVHDSLIEDTEAYDFHRHAFGNSNSNRNVFRRLYCHDRGPYPGDSGDGCVTWYPGSDNIAENIVSEGDSYVADIQALGVSQNNQVLGSIGIGNTAGAFAAYKCRSNDSGSNVPTNIPLNNTLENIVWIGHANAIGFGLTFRGNRNTQLKHATIFNPSTTNYGVSADVESGNPCASPYSVYVENSFVSSTNTTPYGFIIAGQSAWTLTNTNAFGNTTNYQPVTPNANHVGVLAVDPQMGTCKAWVPSSSPMKGAGTGGSDIGATVLYRYVNGALTTTPLWDTTTGEFPHGALVAGINDVAGSSLFDVHLRLNINTGGCSFPTGYPNATPPTPGGITTRYVSSTGSDANSCAASADIGSPKLTLASAVACLAAGDTLYIRSGTWTQQLDVSAKTGTPGNYITIAGYPGETVTLTNGSAPFAIKGTFSSNNAYFIFENMVLDGAGKANLLYWTIAGNTVATASHHIILRNLEIKNWKGNGLLIAANDIQVINCRIHDLVSVSGVAPERWYGIYYSAGANGLVQGNQIYNSPGGGIQAYPGPLTNLKITKNRIYNNNNLAAGVADIGGLFLGQGAGGGVVTGTEISYNLIYSNGRTGSPTAAPGIDVSTSTGTKIYHNVFYDNLTFGIRNGAAGTSTNAIISNNHSVGNGSTNLSDSGVGTTLNTNRTTGSITDCTVSTSDFTQKSGSSCINAGTAISGFPANGLPDQGVFESFTCNTLATVNENFLDLTCGMSLNTPVQPSTSVTGITALVAAVARTTVSSTLLTGTDSVIRTQFNGAACTGGQTWTSTYAPGNITDTSGIPGFNQKALAHTAQAVTNNCGVVPPPPPVGDSILYNLDENTGTTATDAEGGDDPGTLTNGATWEAPGKHGTSAVHFLDGSTQHIAIPYGNAVDLTSQSLTACLGVKPDAAVLSSQRIVFGSTIGTNQRFYLGLIANTWSIGVQADGFWSNPEFSAEATYTRLCMRADSATDTVTLFKNGVKGTSDQSVKPYVTSLILASNLRLGYEPTYAINYGGSTIDDFVLYPSALTDQDILDDKNAWEPASPPSTCTLGQVNHRWHLLRQTSGGAVENYRALGDTVKVVAGGAVMLTIQTDATVAGCSVAERLRYNVNGGATFLEVPDVMGPDGTAFYGGPADTDPDILKGAVTCCLSGALTAIHGATQTNAQAVPVVPFTTNSSSVHRSVLRFDASAAGKTFCFKGYTQQGEAFATYAPSAGACIVVVPMAAGSGF